MTETALLHTIWFIFGEIADKIVADESASSSFSPYINLESGAEGLSLSQHLQLTGKKINAQEAEPAHGHQGRQS